MPPPEEIEHDGGDATVDDRTFSRGAYARCVAGGSRHYSSTYSCRCSNGGVDMSPELSELPRTDVRRLNQGWRRGQ